MIAPLLVCLIVGTWFLYVVGEVSQGPNGVGFENAFATYVSGAGLLQSGGDPYDPRSVCRTEETMLRSQRVPFDQPEWNCRLGNPPLYLWALEPLHNLPFRPTALAWAVGMVLFYFVGFLLLLRWLHWRRCVLPAVLCLLMPSTLYSNFYGEVNGLIFASIVAALTTMRRRPAVSGALAALGWIKPPIAIPFVALMVLFLVPKRLRFLAGFVCTTAGALGVTVATTGMGSIVQWGRSLLAFSHDTGNRGHVVSFLGLYVRVLAPTPRLALEIILILTACGITYAALRHPSSRVSPLESTAWLWTLWFLVTPYGQYYDQVVLAMPVLVFLRPPGSGRLLIKRMIVPYAMALSFLLVAGPVRQVEPLTLIPLAFCLLQFLAVHWRRPVSVPAFPREGHALKVETPSSVR